MKGSSSSEQADLVRCLDCGAVYNQPLGEDEAAPCPDCGYVGWIALSAGQEKPEPES
jgi:uncharacterized paraquat-inducible protein A